MHLSQWSTSDKLSAKLDNEVDISLKLSINFILYMIVLPLSTPSLIGPEKVIYVSAFSPKQSNWSSNSFASFLITIL